MGVPTYRLPSRSRRETVLGLSLAQLLTLTLTLMTGLWAFLVVPDRGLLKEGVTLAVVGAGLALAFFPLGPFALVEWLPVLLGWPLRGHRWQAAGEELGTFALTAEGLVPPGRRPPSVLRGVEVRSASLPGVPALGLLEDRRFRRRVLVVRVRGSGFTLSDTEEQARRIARWGEVLAVLGRVASPIDRVQWIEVAAPEDGAGPKRYLMEEGGRRPEVPDPLLRSYLQLVERAGTVTEHETLVALGLNLSRLRGSREVGLVGHRLRRAGSGQAERLLIQQVQVLAEQLGGEVQVEGVLSPRYLALALRSAFDPEAPLVRSRAERAGQEGGARPEGIWPSRVVEGVGHLEVDGWWHATYRAVELPRAPVGPTFVAPLLLQTTCHRRVAMVIEVQPPASSLRRLERRRTLELVNQQVKARLGFLASAAEELRGSETEAAARELAVGQVLARFALYVTVSGRTAAELEAACREVEQQAALAGIELQRCWGEQARAFTFTLPLGRGLPERG
jgi:hypothetical protein